MVENMIKRNYQKELDAVLSRLELEEKHPKLLLHACCAPCSSYVLEYLSRYFSIVLFYYNPNISPQEEYEKRVAEVRRLLQEMPLSSPVVLTERFFALAKGHEAEPEGGDRCTLCYHLRLTEAARAAKELGCDFFTTTLSISPYKNAEKLNTIGAELAETYGVPYLFSDFKKRNGYKRSIELSREYHLYRQNYCGCVYSRAAALALEANRT